MAEIMLKCENVSKRYRLGVIGGTTLREDLQRLGAKIRGKEDPTRMVGAGAVTKGEFYALSDVSFQVNRGEAVGIIGHNGAGKSTLLKLITRVTGPTDGTISLNGRVASMLEVGTGFHPELTGRENIYMNGAILGMSKAEIDSKLEEIIEFSEVRQFIDTPVKRYSSGMYVKLAFSVAAHLNSEIVIMDEVLAVGDMAFQNKCLTKMREAATVDGRTVLYVSHNMNTIRKLCDRVIVLEKGRVIFDGNVEEGISVYLGNDMKNKENFVDLNDRERPTNITRNAKMQSVEFVDNDECLYSQGEKILLRLKFRSYNELSLVGFRMIVRTSDDNAVGLASSKTSLTLSEGEDAEMTVAFDTQYLSCGKYYLSLALYQCDSAGNSIVLDHVSRACCFDVVNEGAKGGKEMNWEHRYWGYVDFPELKILDKRGIK